MSHSFPPRRHCSLDLLDSSKAEGIYKSAAAFEASVPVFNINVCGMYSVATFLLLGLARLRCNDKCLFYSRLDRLRSIKGRSVSGVTDADESGGRGFLLLKLIYLLLALWRV